MVPNYNDSKERDVIDASLPLIKDLVRKAAGIEPTIEWFGAVHIDPRSCVIIVRVQSDIEKTRLFEMQTLASDVGELLIRNGYPEKAKKHIRTVYESQETVDRDYQGNWRLPFQ